jgi:hypothetical protein
MSKITKESFLLGFKKLEELQTKLNSNNRFIEGFKNDLRILKEQFDSSRVANNLPVFSISIVNPKVEPNGEKRLARYNDPHIRCMASIRIGTINKRLAIFIGNLVDFPNWSENMEVIEIAKKKVFSHLVGLLPEVFTLDSNDESKISFERFSSDYDHLDFIHREMDKCEEALGFFYGNEIEITREMSNITTEHLLPNLNISEVIPDKSKLSDTNHSISYPHYRCTASFKIGNKKNNAFLYLGKSENFPKGKNDPKLLETAKNKSFEYLLKRYPTHFT